MTSGYVPQGKGIGPLLVGGSLIVVGLLFWVFQYFRLDVALVGLLWPFFVIVPGLLLFVIALFARKQGGEPLAIVGSIVTVLGVLLFYQNRTGHWENWAYAWSLLVPCAVGLGQTLFGLLTQQEVLVRAGTRLLVIGAAIFLVGFFFFEVVLGIGGMNFAHLGMARYSWPILLVGVGMIVILFSSLDQRRSTGRNTE